MHVVQEAWLSERLGCTALLITSFGREADLVSVRERIATSAGCAFHQARIACDDVESVRLLGQLGMSPANVGWARRWLAAWSL